MVLELNIQFPLKCFLGYSMLEDKIIMLWTICELLTHFNVSDLIELHNITLAVCLQISSVQSTSTQLQILTQILRFAKFWLKLLFFEKDSRVEISCSSF